MLGERPFVLEELHVSSLGVVEDATLEFHPGLNVLTGETGAGKTMIAVALSVALGGRGSVDLVRQGSGALSVEARFGVAESKEPNGDPDGSQRESSPGDQAPDDADHADPAHWAEEGEVILARAIRADGRSSARIGGRLVPMSALAGVGARLVEIHGQHQAEPLLRPSTQLAFLDRHAGAQHAATLQRYRQAFADLRRARTRLESIERADREREREKDLLQYQVGELEAAAVAPGELEALAEDESRLANAERLRELASDAEAGLAEEGAAADELGRVAGRLAAAAALDRTVQALATRASGLAAEARDLAVEVRGYAEAVSGDPRRLDSVQERIRTIRALERKYGEGEAGILAYLATARKRLALLEGAAEERGELAAAIADLAPRVAELADAVSNGRRAAREALQDAILRELRDLGMPGARFEIQIEPLEQPGPEGAEQVEFRLAGGERQPLMPFSKVASGGELSRTMLACRSVLADLDEVPTLVFDEVDAGIGGAAAAAVGQRLARLGESRQVLVVTHLAQIAAHADRHFRVTKERGTTRIVALDEAERGPELARMLSGEVSEVSLAHAQELIAAGTGRAVVSPSARKGSRGS